MIVNLYIEINRKDQKSEFERLAVLSKYLKANDMSFYDATDFDTCVSGLNPVHLEIRARKISIESNFR